MTTLEKDIGVELTNEERDAIDAHLESKGLPLNVGVTFADVTLPEQYSEVLSRADIPDSAFRSRFARDTFLNIPIMSANMESVTGADMASALAREGGVGCIPQMLSLKDRIDMIQRVRRVDSAFIRNPLVIAADKTLREAKILMKQYGVNGILAVDRSGRLVGIMSARDWLYEKEEEKLVYELMGAAMASHGKRKVIYGREGISFDAARDILRVNRVEKLPLINDYGLVVGLFTAHGLFYEMHHPRALRDATGRFLVVGSVGIGKQFTWQHLYEIEKQCNEGITALLVDTARAYSLNAKNALESIKYEFPDVTIIIGNVSSPEGAKFLFEHGADAVKVNQGRGHVCRTSEVGVGIPQLTAIAKCSVIAHRYGGTIIGDGGMKSIGEVRESRGRETAHEKGVKNPGDFAKAIVAGADTLMTGYLLASTQESAAPPHFSKEGLPVKNYEGSASYQAQTKRIQSGTLDGMRRPEGITEEVVITGTLHERVEDILHGLRSAMSYVGAWTLEELREKGRFELQTNAGWFEGVKKK